MEHEARDFDAEILASREVHTLPGCWPPTALRALLLQLDFDDAAEVADDDLLEMTTMALQDKDVDEASDHVLVSVFGDRMRPGVRQNTIPDLREDRPWEEFAEISQQAGLFEAIVLLQRAFPRDFGKPDAVCVQLRVSTQSKSAGAWLDAPSVDAGLLLRIVACGMDDHAVMRRLFEAPLAADRFSEASGIVWRAERLDALPPVREFELYSSHQWFDALLEPRRFSARAWPDVSAAPRD